MADHRLQVIETLDPTTRVVELSGSGPSGTGAGADNYLCGSCGNVLSAGMRPGQIPSTLTGQVASTVIRCGKCKATNAVP
jgi:hypothetical protein